MPSRSANAGEARSVALRRILTQARVESLAAMDRQRGRALWTRRDPKKTLCECTREPRSDAMSTLTVCRYLADLPLTSESFGRITRHSYKAY
jgi:hypothetical protein